MNKRLIEKASEMYDVICNLVDCDMADITSSTYEDAIRQAEKLKEYISGIEIPKEWIYTDCFHCGQCHGFVSLFIKPYDYEEAPKDTRVKCCCGRTGVIEDDCGDAYYIHWNVK